MEPRILRTPEAARYCGLSPHTLEKMRANGIGPRSVRLGVRAIGYEIEALDEWLGNRPRCAHRTEDGRSR